MIINMNGAKAPETPSPVLQEKTVTPETLPTVIGPDEGYDGLSQVTVNPDAQLKAENIRSGKTIFGVTGVFGGGDTTLSLDDLKPYVYVNAIIHANLSRSFEMIPCAIQIKSMTPLPTQGYQYQNEINIARNSFDYENVSYKYAYTQVKNTYGTRYEELICDLTIPAIRVTGSTDAEKDTPPVTEGRIGVYLQNLRLYDDNDNLLALFVPTTLPEQGVILGETVVTNLTSKTISFAIDLPEFVANNMRWVTTAKTDLEKAAAYTKSVIYLGISTYEKVVK